MYDFLIINRADTQNRLFSHIRLLTHTKHTTALSTSHLGVKVERDALRGLEFVPLLALNLMRLDIVSNVERVCSVVLLVLARGAQPCRDVIARRLGNHYLHIIRCLSLGSTRFGLDRRRHALERAVGRHHEGARGDGRHVQR